MDAVFLICFESGKLLITSLIMISISIFAFIYMNCTGDILRVGSWKVGKLINGRIEEKKFEMGGFGTHGRVIRNKNFFGGGLSVSIPEI